MQDILRSEEDFAMFRALLEDELPGKEFHRAPPAGAVVAARRKAPLT